MTGDETSPPAADAEREQRIAVVGMACRYPEAADTAAMLDLVVTGRRAFRRVPPPAGGHRPGHAARRPRAALIGAWTFDHSAIGIPAPNPADARGERFLALETSARALAGAGLAGLAGRGDAGPAWRAAAFIGSGPLPDGTARAPGGQSPRTAAVRFLAPFAAVAADPADATLPGPVSAEVCRCLGLDAGGITVAAGGASALAAVAAACLDLSRGGIDLALAGGVEVAPGEPALDHLARSGVLADDDMRVYDQNPTGYLPGEGCGIVLLMRTADAVAAGLPVYAEILGWGIASATRRPAGEDGTTSQLAAMRQAYQMARLDPADVDLIEGCGAGLAAADETELAALRALREGAHRAAALGAVSGNIGNTGAAAGAAGLIKAVLAAANGVLPPSTGIRNPHPMLSETNSRLRPLREPQAWHGAARHAAVGGSGTGNLAVHLVLRAGPGQPAIRRTFLGRPRPAARGRATAAPEPGAGLAAVQWSGTYPDCSRYPFAYLIRAADRTAAATALSRIASLAPWLSDGQLQDLAVHLARTAVSQGRLEPGLPQVRVGLVAAGQDQLASLAAEAAGLLPGLGSTPLVTRPGIVAAESFARHTGPSAGRAADDPAGRRPAGRVALLLAGQPSPADLPQRELSRILAVLRWLDDIGVQAVAAAGHGVGEVAGLVWAGCARPADARALIALRSSALSAPASVGLGQLSTVMDRIAGFGFLAPGRRLLSGCLGTVVDGPEAITGLLSAELLDARLVASAVAPADARSAGARLADAVRCAAQDADLLLRTGLDRQLADAVNQLGPVPVVGIDGDPADDRHVAHAAAALFAIGAITRPDLLYAGRPSRAIDIWSEQILMRGASEPGGALPAHADAGRAAPGQKDPGQADAGQTDPAQADAEQADAEQADPAKADARQTDPAQADPGQPDPGQPDASQADPSQADPAQADPGQADPGQADAGQAAAEHRAARRPGTDSMLAGGLARWARCFAEETRVTSCPAGAGDDRPWLVHAGGCGTLRSEVEQLFRPDQRADRTLAVLGGLDEAGTRAAALTAAQDAIKTGRLVAISPWPTLAGFWATLHAEHPGIGVTTVRAPLTTAGLRAAREVAVAEPGYYREFVIGQDGKAAEPVMIPVPLPGGAPFPFGSDDVVLVSRGSGAAGLAFAQVLACSGAAVVLVGRDHPRGDDQIIADLERLRDAGARIGYEIVDMADHGAMIAAIRRIESRFGRVTALSHATGATVRMPVAGLSHTAVHEQIRRQVVALDQMTAALQAAGRGVLRRSGRLRYVVTFGSVIGRYGLAGEALLALATGALAEHAQRLADAAPGCRCLHVDWPAWSGTDLGQRGDLADACDQAGFTAMPPADGSRLLLKLLATEGLPGRLAVHGRVGLPAPRPIAAARSAAAASGGQPSGGRFIERVLVHYPGAELIAEATLSVRTDPYLNDYRADEVPVLAPTMALEAMAQAASVLAGRPLRRVTGVTMTAPIVLPAGAPGSATVIRICAHYDADSVRVRLRSDNSDFAVDHCLATFSRAPQLPKVQGAAAAAGPWPPSAPPWPGPAWIDSSDLYGPVCFQAGRFRRLAAIHLAGAGAASALADGADRMPWFGTGAGTAPARELALGSPGLADAALQLVQACVPHRRLMPAGCESATFSGRTPTGAVCIRAAEAEPASDGRTGAPGESVWHVDAADADGHPLVAWRGLRMRDAGPLPHAAPWPAALLGSYLERAAAELGLGPGLRIRTEAADVAGRAGAPAGQPGGRLMLRTQAPGPASAGWHPARLADVEAAAGGEGLGLGWLAMLGSLPPWLSHLGSTLPAAAASQQAVSMAAAQATAALAAALAACLRGDDPPADLTVATRNLAGVDWLVLRTGDATIAATVLDVADCGAVAFALMTGVPGRDGTTAPGDRAGLAAGGAGGPAGPGAIPRPRPQPDEAAAGQPSTASPASTATSTAGTATSTASTATSTANQITSP